MLFDKDAAGIQSKKELLESVIYKNKRANAAVQVDFLKPSQEIIGLYNKKIDFYYEIEHLLSVDC